MKLLPFIGFLALALTACAPPAGGNPGSSNSATFTTITATQLMSMMDNKDFLLVNVHVPYAGQIKGTDLFLPYNTIEQSGGKLPANKKTRIVVYCVSGMMSDVAARTLARLGYTNVMNLEGGMDGWQQAGYQLAQPPK